MLANTMLVLVLSIAFGAILQTATADKDIFPRRNSRYLEYSGAPGVATVNRPQFFEYVGASGNPIDLSTIPVDEGVDFYLLLSFAIDRDSTTNKTTNGHFLPYWTDSLTPKSILKFKQQHPNAKVLFSLYGWSLYAGGQDNVIGWYDPADPKSWHKNAVNSLTALLKEYHADGIDIDYETIDPKSTFTKMIGNLITDLKKTGAVTVATLAPYTLTNDVYTQLFRVYSSVIDYVLYQFYSEAAMGTPQLVRRFNSLAKSSYSYEKLVWGYQIGEKRLPSKELIGAVSIVEQQGIEIVGIMVYSADEGKGTGFVDELKFQTLLLSKNGTAT